MPTAYDILTGRWQASPEPTRYDASGRRWAVNLSHEDSGWRTINGAHVHIGDDGKIDKGPKQFVGTHPSEHGHGGGDDAKHGTGKSAARLATAIHAHKAVVANGVAGHIDPAHVNNLIGNLNHGLSAGETQALMEHLGYVGKRSKAQSLAMLREHMHNGFEGRMRAETERGTAGYVERDPGKANPVPRLPDRGTERDDLPERKSEPKVASQPKSAKPAVPKGPAAPRASGGSVESVVDGLRGVQRMTQAGTLGREEIKTAVDGMASLSVPQIHEALAKVGITAYGKSKGDLLRNVADTLDNYAEAAMRVQTMRADR